MLIPTNSTFAINLDKRQRIHLENLATHVICRFTCSCGNIYTSRTDRQLKKRLFEHILCWLKRSMLLGSPKHQPNSKNPSSSTAKHVLVTGHVVESISSFKFLLCNLSSKLLTFSEAMLIRLRNPPGHSQKLLTQSIHLL